ncbi:hypothetical protein F6455_07625 [Proteobacteria bacterium 005FR1]|nr:hypothetical protein [Proteobacteria bacterium 005FR1]
MDSFLAIPAGAVRRTSVTAILSFLVISQAVATEVPPRIGLLYWVGGNQLSRANVDGSEFEVLLTDLDEPDGLVTDPLNNLVYWTNMSFGGPGGSLQRARLDGSPVEKGESYLVPPGSFQVGKEIELDSQTGKLYWADRDGRHVMRANADGSQVEPVLHAFMYKGAVKSLENPVGIALDSERRQIYITDRFMGTVLRFGMDAPAGEHYLNRSDVEILVQPRSKDDRPIDIDLDLEQGHMYWTDRGVHQVLRADLDGSEIEVLVDPGRIAIKDPIGMSLDLVNRQMYWTDMSTHKIHRANLDGSQVEEILGGSQLLNGVPYGPLGIQYRALEPERGSAAGGNRIALLGDNFVAGETEVRLGSAKAADVEVVDEKLLYFTAPAGKPGRVELTVITPTGKASLREAYRYE